MTSSSNGTAITLRIELEGIEPLIWRRFTVPGSITLSNLHKVIQAVMGWHDCHLWTFTARDQRYGIFIAGDEDWNERIKSATKISLGTILSDGLKEIEYAYDFGDDWQHRIIVEGSKPAVASTVYPQFLGGERRCPPEDCGGIPGYYEFLERITATSAQKRKAALDWYGGSYDPNDIDEQEIIKKFKAMAFK